MTTRSIADYLGAHPFCRPGRRPSSNWPGARATSMSGPGNTCSARAAPPSIFYVVMHGQIALELFSQGIGPQVVDSADDGEVPDWPWLIPPHQWVFNARAAEPASVVSLDSACLRGKCEAGPRLGHEFMQRWHRPCPADCRRPGCACPTPTAPHGPVPGWPVRSRPRLAD
jgi:CRP/FNR family cyclic AMP-dependent transcriptional regulator